jgi:hypothetical protein
VRPARLSSEAVEELFEAAAWYRDQQQGLELEFLAEVDRILPMLETSPASFPRVLGLAVDLEIRRALLPRFPYALVFVETEREIRILAVAHLKRRPGYWLNRVEP